MGKIKYENIKSLVVTFIISFISESPCAMKESPQSRSHESPIPQFDDYQYLWPHPHTALPSCRIVFPVINARIDIAQGAKESLRSEERIYITTPERSVFCQNCGVSTGGASRAGSTLLGGSLLVLNGGSDEKLHFDLFGLGLVFV